MKRVFNFLLKNVAKRVAITVIALFAMSIIFSASAQKGDKSVGVSLSIGSRSEITNFGISGKFQYNVTNPIRLSSSFTYFPQQTGEKNEDWYGQKTDVNMWDLSINMQYLFILTVPWLDNTMTIYPMVGFGILGVKGTITDLSRNLFTWAWNEKSRNVSDTFFGFNIFGAGYEFVITEQLLFNFETKFMIVPDWSRATYSIGLTYKF